MERRLVSVIIIFLDAERFIGDAIASVLAQTYDCWELLLVDDGSTDGSTAVASEWARRHPDKIRYLEHPGHENRGMSASRNRGLHDARGEFIAFLDADDVWLPTKLEDQVAIMAAQPRAAMVYGRTEIWSSWNGEGVDGTFDLGVPADTLVEPPTLFLLLLENRAQNPTTCNALMRRSAVTRVGGFENTFRGMFEDQAFFIKLCLNLPVFVSGRCWARYRQHAGSCSAIAEARGEVQGARLSLLRWITHYLAEQRVTDRRVRRALAKELWPLEHPSCVHWASRARQVLRRIRRAASARWV